MTRNRQSRRAKHPPTDHGQGTSPTTAEIPRKTMQLCRQVEQTLSLVLSGECNDEVVQSLLVESVTPAPNASQLLVTVRQFDGDERVSTLEILQRLGEFESQIRFAVASAVTRKRAPKLLYQVL